MKNFLLILLIHLSLIVHGQSFQVTESVQKETWFVNSRYGIVFEAPKILEKVDFEKPAGAEMVDDIKIYLYRDGSFVLQLFVIESNFETYNLESGLRGGITNQLLTGNAENIQLDFTYPDNENCIYCKGTAEISGHEFIIRGFANFDGNGRVCSLFGLSDPSVKSTAKINRVFNTIKVIDY